MTTDRLPEELRRAVERDLAPVRPLPPAWRRSLAVAAVAVAVFAATLVVSKSLRDNLHDMPMWLSWGAALLQLGVGVLLASLALRESVPGNGIPTSSLAAAIVVGFSTQLLVGLVTWIWFDRPSGIGWAGSTCMTNDLRVALPVFAVALWMVFRALPLRAPAAGALAGTGAALISDAVGHLRCPMSNPEHILMWHTGAIVILAAAGWLVGWVWSRLRWRQKRG